MTQPLSRRAFLEIGGRAGIIAASATAGGGTLLTSPREALAVDQTALGARQRRQRAYQIRHDAAQGYLAESLISHRSNGDEDRYEDKRASFSKTLPHNSFGEVDPQAYAAWLLPDKNGNIMETCLPTP